MATANPNEYVRVEDVDTKHRYSIMRRSVNEKAHKIVDEAAVDAGGNPLPAVHYVAKKAASSGGGN